MDREGKEGMEEKGISFSSSFVVPHRAFSGSHFLHGSPPFLSPHPPHRAPTSSHGRSTLLQAHLAGQLLAVPRGCIQVSQ